MCCDEDTFLSRVNDFIDSDNTFMKCLKTLENRIKMSLHLYFTSYESLLLEIGILNTFYYKVTKC